CYFYSPEPFLPSFQPGSRESEPGLAHLYSQSGSEAQGWSEAGSCGPVSDSRVRSDPEPPVKCDVCGKVFRYEHSLVEHQGVHSGVKPYGCNTCGKSFTQPSGLKVHMRIHTGERPFTCETCGKSFRYSSHFHTCGKGFCRRFSLKVHRKTHTAERPYKCETCGKSFRDPSLNVHSRTHTGERPYLCVTCGKGFINSSQLSLHSRTHTGEKPFSCDFSISVPFFCQSCMAHHPSIFYTLLSLVGSGGAGASPGNERRGHLDRSPVCRRATQRQTTIHTHTHTHT
uniref:C2H2-type domain-containing protein n=1 Tax=Poecilia mexicana TaxID=48701 RepID=A0A3B3YCM9_9TELE